MNINLKFRNEEQELFYWHTQRNGHFGGGFGNGKSYVACQRAFTHLVTFSNYGMVIARQKYKVLKATTMKTFFKMCPKELIYRHDEQDGYTVLINKSFIFWMHLDAVDEQDVRGLETNSVLIDQGEEIEESIANVLDARVGRWDGAIVPDYLLLLKVTDLEVKKEIEAYKKERSKDELCKELLFKHSNWPKDSFGERFLVPNYFDVLSNPSEEDELHWIWRNYNPQSPERLPEKTVFHIERKTQDELNDAGSISRILNRDQEFIDKYYYGKTGSPRALIHTINPSSIINPKDYKREDFDAFITRIKTRGALVRILDHGDTGVTTCGWEATLKNVHIFYREYYQSGKFISDHRQNIYDLSEGEEYVSDVADPDIFRKHKQKNGELFTVAEEYSDLEEIKAPPIYWEEADNNEFATRNRINELLRLDSRFKHPITNESPAPGIFFIKADGDIYPYGVIYGIIQTKAQKRMLLGSLNGKNIYSEERDVRVIDHAYDYVRYGIARHNIGKKDEVRKAPKRSFAFFNALLKQHPGFEPTSSKR